MKHIKLFEDYSLNESTESFEDRKEYVYLDKTVNIDDNCMVKSIDDNNEVNRNIALGGVQWVLHTKFPNITQQEKVSISQSWFWHNIPEKFISKMKPTEIKFYVKHYGERK